MISWKSAEIWQHGVAEHIYLGRKIIMITFGGHIGCVSL